MPQKLLKMPPKTPFTASKTPQKFFASVKAIISSSYENKAGLRKIYLQVFINTKKVMLPVDIAIKEADWDAVKCCMRRGAERAADINLMIEKARSVIADIMIKYNLEGKQITPNMLKAEYKNPTRMVDFYTWVETEISRRVELASSTQIMHRSIINKMKSFRKKLYFSEIDSEFAAEYHRYLKKIGNDKETVHKNIKTVKAYINRAIRNGIMSVNPFVGYKVPRSQSNREALSEDQLSVILNHYRAGRFYKRQEKAVKFLLFSCFTGLRISDILALKWEDVLHDTIIIRPKKTQNVNSKLIKVPLSKIALDIAESEKNRFKVKGYIFDRMTSQTINKTLKEIADLCGFDINLSMHVGRHTFATIFLKYNPGDIATLKELLGHARIQETMVYVHVTEDTKRERIQFMEKFMP